MLFLQEKKLYQKKLEKQRSSLLRNILGYFMPVITKISLQKFKNRVNIYLDGKFGFGLDIETFVKSNIKIEQELTHSEIEKITQKGEYQKVLEKLLVFASLRPRSIKEFNNWMRKHEVSINFQNDLFDRLKRLGLADDFEFAKWWVEQRQSFRPKPKSILYQELLIKGIKKEIITDLLSKTKVDEKNQIKQLLQKNAYKWVRFDKRIARQKMSMFLARKGFSWDVIKNVLRDFLEIDD